MGIKDLDETKIGVDCSLHAGRFVRLPRSTFRIWTAYFIFSVTITSVLRVQAFKPDELNDVTYSTVNTIVWSIVEQGIGIVCACLPTMRPLLIRILSGRLQTTSEEMGSFGILPDPATNYEPDVDILRSVFEPAQNSENTIGFARPHDNMVITLPVAQCSTCVSIAAITSPSAEDGDERPSPIIGVAL